MEQSSLTTENIRAFVSAKINGAAYDPSGDVVKMAFVPVRLQPVDADWNPASWSVVSGPSGDTYYAICLVGPGNGGVALATGEYGIWVKITDNPEIPVRQIGELTIT